MDRTQESEKRLLAQDAEEGEAQVSVEMGVQCDGVYTELDEDTRLAGVDAALMHKKCGEVREVVGLLL